MTRPLKPVPEFKQGLRESEAHFMNRIEREAGALLNKVKLEEKFKVSLANVSLAVILVRLDSDKHIVEVLNTVTLYYC